jgi:hypothetical protein
MYFAFRWLMLGIDERPGKEKTKKAKKSSKKRRRDDPDDADTQDDDDDDDETSRRRREKVFPHEPTTDVSSFHQNGFSTQKISEAFS